MFGLPGWLLCSYIIGHGRVQSARELDRGIKGAGSASCSSHPKLPRGPGLVIALVNVLLMTIMVLDMPCRPMDIALAMAFSALVTAPSKLDCPLLLLHPRLAVLQGTAARTLPRCHAHLPRPCRHLLPCPSLVNSFRRLVCGVRAVFLPHSRARRCHSFSCCRTHRRLPPRKRRLW